VTVQRRSRGGLALSSLPATTSRAVGWWLLVLCTMVVGMVLLGGYTRLTHSGLSMVEWKPATVLPPGSETEWQAAFEDYRTSPEYQRINRGMTLDEFKSIYYPEYLHRLWGRALGFVLLGGFVWFLVRRRISRAMLPRVLGVMALAALQGVIGWLMVASGLVERPDVSHYRLAAHLLAAFAIYAWMLWLALEILRPARPGGTAAAREQLRRPLIAVAVATVITATWGAFTAGLDAGFIYNRFPLMGDRPWPDSLGPGSALLAAVEEPGVVQFVHRMLAWTTAALAVWLVVRIRRSDLPRAVTRSAMLVPAVVGVQFALGVSTLVLTVPVALGMAHQLGALVLLSVALLALGDLRRRVPPGEAAHRRPLPAAGRTRPGHP
jgi:cytochrome c oxidase assembly protein subunit 15